MPTRTLSSVSRGNVGPGSGSVQWAIEAAHRRGVRSGPSFLARAAPRHGGNRVDESEVAQLVRPIQSEVRYSGERVQKRAGVHCRPRASAGGDPPEAAGLRAADHRGESARQWRSMGSDTPSFAPVVRPPGSPYFRRKQLGQWCCRASRPCGPISSCAQASCTSISPPREARGAPSSSPCTATHAEHPNPRRREPANARSRHSAALKNSA